MEILLNRAALIGVMASIVASPSLGALRVVFKSPATACSSDPGAIHYNYTGGRNIQKALDEAASGDDILVCAGTYQEALTLADKSLTLRGEQNPNQPGAASISRLDGSGLPARILTSTYGQSGHTLTLRNLRFSNGSAGGSALGGAVSMVLQSGLTTAALALDATLFDANTAPGGGGAVHALRVNLSIGNSEFQGNSSGLSTSRGGAIYADRGSLTIAGSKFSANVSSGLGGAVFLDGQEAATISGTSFLNNSASSTSTGGAVFTRLGNLTITGNTTFISNSAGSAGALHVNGIPDVGESPNCAQEIRISQTEFQANSAVAANGGAVILTGIPSCPIDVEFSQAAFESNFSQTSGGAILSVDASLFLPSCDFTGNTAGTSGGAILIQDGVAAIDGSTFSMNRASTQSGGAILSAGADLSIVGGYFDLNESVSGGGAILFHTGELALNGVSFSFNETSGMPGGALLADGAGNISLINSQFYSNQSGGSAGAAYLSATQTDIISSDFISNRAATDGGALLLSTSARITEAFFEGNESHEQGGAIKSFGEQTEVHRSIFRNNKLLRTDAGSQMEPPAVVENVRLLRNSLVHGNESGSGIIVHAFETINSTVYNNIPLDGDVVVPVAQVRAGTIRNSILWHSDIFDREVVSVGDPLLANAAHSFIKGGFSGGTAIYNLPPQLINDNPGTPDFNDFRPKPTSPVLNKGNTSLANPEEPDLAGNPRISGGVSPGQVDIGAYEFQGDAKHTVTITSNEGGLVLPKQNGSIEVASGSDRQITIITSGNYGAQADFRGYRIKQVLVDGVATPVVSGFFGLKTVTLANVQADHHVHVEFEKISFNVTITTEGEGYANPSGVKQVVYPVNSLDIEIVPAAGSQVERIVVGEGTPDEKVHPGYAQEIFTLTGIYSDKTVKVVFEPCGPLPDVKANYVEVKEFNKGDGTDPFVSYLFNDGFGNIAQTQSRVSPTENMVSGGYANSLGSFSKSIKPYLKADGGTPGFVCMHCENLVTEANDFYDGVNDPDNAGDFAFLEASYRRTPDAALAKVGFPGRDYSLVGNHAKTWAFGVSSMENSVFLPHSDLATAGFLDAKESAAGEYSLEVLQDENGFFSQNIRDKNGRTIKSWVNPSTTESGAIITTFSYDPLGQIKQVAPQVAGLGSTFKYNSLGQMIERVDPDRGKTEYQYDVNGRVTFTRTALQVARSGTLKHYLIHDYDHLGRLVRIRENNGTITFETEPKSIPLGNSVVKSRNIYDGLEAADLLALNLDQHNTYLTDDLIEDLVDEIHAQPGKLMAVITYSESDIPVVDLISYAKNGLPEARYKLLPVDVPPQKSAYGYDGMGKTVSLEVFSDYIGGQWQKEYEQSFAHDKFGRLESISRSSPDDVTLKKLVEYVYDKKGELKEQKVYAYSGVDPLKTIAYDYNVRGWLASITSSGTASYYREEIDRSGLFDGSVSARTYRYKVTTGGPEQEFHLGYTYDRVKRLITVSSAGNSDFASEYRYDAASRLVRKKEGATDYENYNYGTGNQLTHHPGQTDIANKPKDYVFDPNGNMVLDRTKKMVVDFNWKNIPVRFRFYNSIPNQELTWTHVRGNGLAAPPYNSTQVQFVEMTYDASDERVVRYKSVIAAPTESELSAHVDKLIVHSVATFDAQGNPGPMTLDHINYLGKDGVSGKLEFRGAKNEYLYLLDEQGSVRAVIGADEIAKFGQMYQAYGAINRLLGSGAADSREKYSGQALEETANLYAYKYRFYDPDVGVWISVDPMSSYTHSYSFLGGDPLNQVDFLGLTPIEGEGAGADWDGDYKPCGPLIDCGTGWWRDGEGTGPLDNNTDGPEMLDMIYAQVQDPPEAEFQLGEGLYPSLTPGDPPGAVEIITYDPFAALSQHLWNTTLRNMEPEGDYFTGMSAFVLYGLWPSDYKGAALGLALGWFLGRLNVGATPPVKPIFGSPTPAASGTGGLAALAESNAGAQLAKMEAKTPGAHYLKRHGAQTTIEAQYERALTGLTPDGVQGNPVNSSRFMTNQQQLQAVQRAQTIHKQTGQNKFQFDMGTVVGEGVMRGGSGLTQSSHVFAYFKNGQLYTLFPLLTP